MSGPAFDALTQKRKKIATELAELETRIYNLETEYVAQAECSAFGTVLKGFEGFITTKSSQAKNKNRNFRIEDRVFSLSSYTSPATREQQSQREVYVEGEQYGRYSLKRMGAGAPPKGGY